jgi:hypothetical protein
METTHTPGKQKASRRKARTPEEKRKRKRKRRIILLSVVGVLVIFRLILPWIVLKYVNNKLANLEEYYGHVEDIDIHLYRGAYEIRGIRIVKKTEKGGKQDTIPFFSAPSIDLSVEWSAIFDGAIVGEIGVERPVVNFVKEKHQGEDVKADTADFRQLIDDLMPITINRFDIHRGEVHYHDPEAQPKLDIAMKNINLTATNLTNANDAKEVLPSKLTGSAEAYEGKFNLNVKFDGLSKVPTFDLNTELKGLNLVLLNDFLREYANVDVKKGTFSMYAEFAAKNNRFGGYAKPILKDLDVVQWNKEEGNAAQILWETVVAIGAEVFQNQRKEQAATKIPIEGSFDNMKVNTWRALGYVLRNAFLQALRPSLDNTVNINNLDGEQDKSVLERWFGKDKKDTEPKKKKSG